MPRFKRQRLDRRPRGLSRRAFLQSGTTIGAAAGVAAAVPPPARAAGQDPLVVGRLRADARKEPMGIQATRPQLSWTVTGTGRGRRTTAYQVRVATSPGLFRTGRADLWESGRVESDAVSVQFGGEALASRTRGYWQVRVWDENGQVSPWSPVSWFEIGLLQPAEWSAGWIGNPDWDALVAPTPPATITFPAQQARFVRLSVTRLGLPLKEGWPYLVSRLQIAEFQVFYSSRPEVNLALHAPVTATDVYSAPGSWEPEYVTDGKTDGSTPPIGFTSLEHQYPDVSADPILVTIDLGSTGTFDRVALWPRTDTLTPDGKTANFPVDFTIQVADSADGPFTVAAAVTGQQAPQPAPRPAALPLFARQFTVRKPVSRARLYVTGLGIYTTTVNGQHTSNALLEPGNTTYTKRVNYATCDVADLLQPGTNAIGIAVGTGIYDTSSYNTRYAKFRGRIGPPKVLAQLEITYTDGTSERVGTDTDWWTMLGATTFSNWYGGEDFDARRLPAGWDLPGADLSGWQPATASAAPAPDAALTARHGPAIEAVDVLPTQRLSQPQPGVYVFDIGTNLAGRQVLKVSGPVGTAITMRPAELLHADGTIDYGSTGNPIYDVYTLRGAGTETWNPEFIYHGFRYIQVEGLPAAPGTDAISALVTRAANESAGSFSCSNDLLNGIHRIIDRAVQSNMFSVLTDCPHREKLGWMEEDHLVFEAVARNYDVAAYGNDLVQAMADAQLPNGLVPDIAPEYTVFSGGFRDDPNWGSAIVLVSLALYRAYGDTDVLARFYPNMQRYVDYLTGKASGNLLDYGLGDWATINASTPAGVTATYGYFKAVDGLRRIATAVGNSDDAARYTQLAAAIGAAFHTKYFDAANHTYATGSQCSDALALDMGVVPEAERAAVLDHLVANLRNNAYHLNIGEIGLPALFDVLAAAGRNDVMYEIATQTTAPSYGAMLARGATSLTEFWDGTGSQNHFMLGAIDKWFTTSLAGIGQPADSVGYAEVLIAPAIVGDLTQVSGRYRTPRGLVTSEWQRSRQTVQLDVSIPVGTSATVRLPGRADERVPSGDYRFTTTLPA
ncbi:MAG TPA: family 78 glycoside hydrolase catalytic domain [Jatrophihabitans sp.]|nr:family 78 glycoside hydrolase catalytic domain [Jatrophihabitans sp.]